MNGLPQWRGLICRQCLNQGHEPIKRDHCRSHGVTWVVALRDLSGFRFPSPQSLLRPCSLIRSFSLSVVRHCSMATMFSCSSMASERRGLRHLVEAVQLHPVAKFTAVS